MSGEPFAPDDKQRPPLRELIWAAILYKPASYLEDAPLIRVWVTTVGILAILAASVLVSAIVAMVIVKCGQLFGFW